MHKLRKPVSFFCAFAVMLAALALPALADVSVNFEGGSGMADDPWRIATLEQFEAFAGAVNDGSQNGYAGQFIALAADIDLAGVSWQPIGNMGDMERFSTLFQGTFDGQGHTISNFVFTTGQYTVGAGIFGVNLGAIKNLTVENAAVTVTDATSQAIAAVVGYNMGTVDGVSLVGENAVTGNCCVGGLIGGNMGIVTNCTVEGTTITVIGDNDFSEGIVQVDIAECGGLLIGGGFGGLVDGCAVTGTVICEGNEPVGLGGIGGCLEMMDSVTNCTADVHIISAKGGHAIGGLCGYAGTHSNGNIVAETEGITTVNYPGVIENCTVRVRIDAPSATHVGGLVGTGLYYYGEETAFALKNCTVTGEIDGAVTPGAIAGRAQNSTIENCTAEVTWNAAKLTEAIGTTDRMYESADQ